VPALAAYGFRACFDRAGAMDSGLADFIEHRAETILEHAITFAKW
jgi:hypothetical protein